MKKEEVLSELNVILSAQLPGAGVSVQRIPKSDQLKLALIDPAFDDSCISQEVQDQLMNDPPYWIFCWASGHAVAELLSSGQYDVKDKVVVDFGAGGGAAAISAKLAGAKKVYACDIDPVGNRVCELNARINNVEIEMITNIDDAHDAEVLLAADVLYEQANYYFLDMFLDKVPEILVADSRLKRMHNPNYNLWKTIETTSFPDFHEALEFNRVNLYRNINNAV